MPSVNQKLTIKIRVVVSLVLALAGWLGASVAALAQGDVPDRDGVAATATYADLVTLAERSDMVIRARIRDQIQLPPERAPGLAPGFARLYIEAETTALIAGTTPVGEELTYLVDVRLRENGKAPRIAGLEMLLFARPVAGRRGAIQLTGQPAQFPYSEALETRLRPILTELVGGNPPPRITGIGNALAVPGTLAGESETQIFLTTDSGSPVSLTVLRRPAQPPVWGVSWGEIVDSAAKPPAPESLRWYRLACALPEELPADVNLARDPEARRLAERDYALVREQLGACRRSLTRG